jgi:putative endonuclease
MSPWYVYMVRCKDNTLYTGIAKDLTGRIAAHNSPRGGAKYTRSRQPVVLVYAEPAESRSAAAKREYRLRRLPLTVKLALIAANPVAPMQPITNGDARKDAKSASEDTGMME